MSTLAVASSSISIGLFLSKALARQKSCLWPTLKLLPPSVMIDSKLSSNPSTTDFNWTWIQYIIEPVH